VGKGLILDFGCLRGNFSFDDDAVGLRFLFASLVFRKDITSSDLIESDGDVLFKRGFRR